MCETLAEKRSSILILLLSVLLKSFDIIVVRFNTSGLPAGGQGFTEAAYYFTESFGENPAETISLFFGLIIATAGYATYITHYMAVHFRLLPG